MITVKIVNIPNKKDTVIRAKKIETIYERMNKLANTIPMFYGWSNLPTGSGTVSVMTGVWD